MRIVLITHLWPKDDTDSSGVFVRAWLDQATMLLEPEMVTILILPAGERLSIGRCLVRIPWWVLLALCSIRRGDLVVSHWLFPSSLVVRICKMFKTFQSYVVLHGDPYVLRTPFKRKVAKWILGTADTVQVVSESCREALNGSGVFEGPTFTIPMPLSLSPTDCSVCGQPGQTKRS